MRKYARLIIAAAASLSLLIAVPVSADEPSHDREPAGVEIGCAARWYRTADGIVQEIDC